MPTNDSFWKSIEYDITRHDAERRKTNLATANKLAEKFNQEFPGVLARGSVTDASKPVVQFDFGKYLIEAQPLTSQSENTRDIHERGWELACKIRSRYPRKVFRGKRSLYRVCFDLTGERP